MPLLVVGLAAFVLAYLSFRGNLSPLPGHYPIWILFSLVGVVATSGSLIAAALPEGEAIGDVVTIPRAEWEELVARRRTERSRPATPTPPMAPAAPTGLAEGTPGEPTIDGLLAELERIATEVSAPTEPTPRATPPAPPAAPVPSPRAAELPHPGPPAPVTLRPAVPRPVAVPEPVAVPPSMAATPPAPATPQRAAVPPLATPRPPTANVAVPPPASPPPPRRAVAAAEPTVPAPEVARAPPSPILPTRRLSFSEVGLPTSPTYCRGCGKRRRPLELVGQCGDCSEPICKTCVESGRRREGVLLCSACSDLQDAVDGKLPRDSGE